MIVAERAEDDEQDESDHHPLAPRPGERARPRRRRRAGRRRAHEDLRCCDQTAPAMIAPFTTSAAASGTPLASRV